MNFPEQMFIPSFFPSQLITTCFALENATTQYSQTEILLLSEKVVTLFINNPTKISPGLLSWAVQILPFPLLIQNNSELFPILEKTLQVYKNLLEKQMFADDQKEKEMFLKILLLQLSLFMSRNDIPNLSLDFARFIQSSVINNENNSIDIKLIASHLLFGCARTYINTQYFQYLIPLAINSWQQFSPDSVGFFQQFNTHLEQMYTKPDFCTSIITKFAEVFKLVVKSAVSGKVHKQKWLYDYLYNMIDTEFNQPYKHYGFAETAQVYVELHKESEVYNNGFTAFTVSQFKDNSYKWFNSEYILDYKPESIFNALAFGKRENESDQAFLEECQNKLLEKLIQINKLPNLFEKSDDITHKMSIYLFPQKFFNFLIANPQFLSRDDVSSNLILFMEKLITPLFTQFSDVYQTKTSRNRASSSHDISLEEYRYQRRKSTSDSGENITITNCLTFQNLDAILPFIISLLWAIIQISGSRYKDNINNILSKLLDLLTMYDEMPRSGDSYKFWHDYKKFAANLLLIFILSNENHLFWESFSKISKSMSFNDNEEFIFPYASICSLLSGSNFRTNIDVPRSIFKCFTQHAQDSNFVEKDLHKILVHIFSFAITTTFFEDDLGNDRLLKPLFQNKNDQVTNLIKDIITTAVKCGCYTSFKNNQTNIEDYEKGIHFSTPSTVISVYDNDKLILRNSIGSILIHVKQITHNTQHQTQEIKVDENPDDEVDLSVFESTLKDDVIKTSPGDSDIDLFIEGSQHISHKQFINDKEKIEKERCDFYSKPINAALNLLKNSNLFKLQMAEKVQHIKDPDFIKILDQIDPIPHIQVFIHHMIQNQEFTSEMSPSFQHFIKELTNTSLDPIFTIDYKMSQNPNLVPTRNTLRVIFNESYCIVKKSSDILNNALSIIVSLVKNNNENDPLYIIELASTPKIQSVSLPFFEETKWLVNGKSVSSIISLLSYFMMASTPEAFFNKYIDRLRTISDKFNSSQSKQQNYPIFYKFD